MRCLAVIAFLLHSGAALAGDRLVTDSTGRAVSIPEAPQRVVALHEALLAVPLLELEVEVVGVHGRSDEGGSLMGIDFIASVLGPEAAARRIPGIGAIVAIDLERVRALKPDLIVGTELDQRSAEMLAPIAPVYLQQSVLPGFDIERELAGLFGREERFAALEAGYRARAAELGRRLPGTPGERSYLAVYISDQVYVVGTISGAVQALEDLGYLRALAEGEGEQPVGRTRLVEPLSAEVFGRLDPDLLLVMNGFTAGAHDEAAIRADLDRVVPGWDRFLKPAREGRVVYLDPAKVTTSSIASAEHTLAAIAAWLEARGEP